MRTNEGTVDDKIRLDTSLTPLTPDTDDTNGSKDAAPRQDGFDPGDWKSRIIAGRASGAAAHPPAWLDASYATLCKHVMDPAYPCFFGTMAEKRGEMFYSYVNGKNIGDLP